jgi:hypothetical protein
LVASFLEVGEASELFFHFAEKRRREDAKDADEPAFVDCAALVDHELALLPVPGDSSG